MALFETIKAELRGILGGIEYSVEQLPLNTTPLFMLLTIGQDKAAFASSEKQTTTDYEDAIEMLRNLYANHANEWAKFELNLILCESIRISTDFRTKVEVDPYFCRKFIIDQNQLNAELRRLPFIPLSISKQISERPVSAQTFLIGHGMPSELARYTVTPHARGSERVIEECLRGEWGPPEQRKYEGELFISPTATNGIGQVRLKHLEINGFRAYREKYDFELDTDIIVLFGPNGFGKTSFFDALDFACTGSVARFDERYGRDVDRLVKSLKNLDSPLENCYVGAVLSTDDKEISIQRYLVDHTKAILDGDIKTRKQTLLRIAGLPEESGDIRIENLVRLFRATHLFGQEYQSLTCDFRKESTLKEDIVARMWALQDYVQAIEKTSQVSVEIQRQIREKQSRITNMSADLSLKQSQFDELQRVSKSVEQPEIVARIAKEISSRVEGIGIEVVDSTFNAKTVRGWRSVISAKVELFERKISIFKEIEVKYPEYESSKNKLMETLEHLRQTTISYDEIDKRGRETQAELVSSSSLVENLLSKEKMILVEKDNLNWLMSIQQKYNMLVAELKQQSLVYNDVMDKITTISSRIAFSESQNESLLATIQDKRMQINNVQVRIADLNGLRGEVGQWESYVNQEEMITSDLQVIEAEIKSALDDLNSKQPELLVAEEHYSEMEVRLTTMQDFQSELQQLLHKLEEHITNNICPTCGATYSSRDELIERLRKCGGSESEQIYILRQSYVEIKSKYEQLKDIISAIENRIQGLKQKRDKTAETISDLNAKILKYQQRLSALDIQATINQAEECINVEEKKNLELIVTKQKELDDLLSQAKYLDDDLSVIKDQHANLLANMKEMVAKKEALTNQVATIDQQALERRLSISMTPEHAHNRLKDIEKLIQETRKNMDFTGAKVERVQAAASELELQRHNLQSKVDELSILRDSHVGYIDNMKKLMAEIGLSADVTGDKIQEVGSQFGKELAKLNDLINDLSNLETVLDNAEMSASVARINKDRVDLENEIQTENQVLRSLDNWHIYFQKIRDNLEQLRSLALEEYTESYGPLSTSIQKRLRPVYGFGDIRLRVQKGMINVEVEHQGHEGLSPPDYFSESQIQIAMLSLFLSATLSQNWSRFCPILLDDPVEHFDDLNSYALIGLIKRLASGGGHGRQFIISTCDERLYKLMRQQFNTIERKVAYYRFSALGEKGPIIETP